MYGNFSQFFIRHFKLNAFGFSLTASIGSGWAGVQFPIAALRVLCSLVAPGTWHLSPVRSTHHSASCYTSGNFTCCITSDVIHLATLPVQIWLVGEGLCLRIQKWFWDFFFFLVEFFGTCSSFGFVYTSIIYILTCFCANTWSCPQKNLWTSYVLTICNFLLSIY